ncbi:hypothetical protein J2Z35_002487 [Acetoanaerobium pronyense]|uniref:Lipoprotein n=1 Tax=Acetoanaerobium pronyense TaxID=1482736 RepID=A0ABS4KLJ7_9FIRM|nr:hypothetical protein [Acetoanaerobium pronyense]MBP2028657.1 hypothetical protein [Acetoanaerobium pronyense]
MRKKYLVLSLIVLVFMSIFLAGCSNEEEFGYEILSFEETPKEVQDLIVENLKIISEREDESANDSSNSTIVSSGQIDMGKEKYVYIITSKENSDEITEIPRIIEVVKDEAYGSGIMIKHTTDDTEAIEFPDTVSIVKLEYSGKISNVFLSSP